MDWEHDGDATWMAEITDSRSTLQLIVEEGDGSYTPSVEVWVYTNYMGWDMVDSMTFDPEPTLEAAQLTLEDWVEGEEEPW